MRLLLILAIVCTSTLASAADPPAKPKSLDDQLLDGLKDDLVDKLPAPQKPATPGDKPSPEAGGEDLGSVGESNPLALIGERMRTAQQRIAGHDTSKNTQDLQRRILDDIAALIEQAKKQGAAQKQGSGPGSASTQPGSGGGNPTAGPARDSTNRIEQGTKETTETADVQEVLRRFWGHLPQKLRDQMNAAGSERFLPKYERLIEEYYKRLAEDRPVGP
ncbi:MAG: hypothetical protein SFU86_13510 [Pirellulaceae bacterium]|nr:hypothetical protein [Pirellulaceae bacterium]